MAKYLLLIWLLCWGVQGEAKKYTTVKFGLCTDVHLPTMHDGEQRMTSFITAMNKVKPDFILEMGDFTTPDPRYAPGFAIWNSFQGDKYHVIGNHEMDGGYSREQTMAFLGLKKSYYSFEKKGFHFIVLDGNDKKDPTAKGYKQFMGEEQVNWLRQDLAGTNYPVVIFSHQGLITYRSADETYGVENNEDIRKILNSHNLSHPGKSVVACFNGHTHYDDAIKVDGIWYITITSMSYHWLGERYVHATFGDEIDKKFKWIKYTAPFRDPLFTTVEISTRGTIRIAGKQSEWVGATPWQLGYPESQKQWMRPAISTRKLRIQL